MLKVAFWNLIFACRFAHLCFLVRARFERALSSSEALLKRALSAFSIWGICATNSKRPPFKSHPTNIYIVMSFRNFCWPYAYPSASFRLICPKSCHSACDFRLVQSGHQLQWPCLAKLLPCLQEAKGSSQRPRTMFGMWSLPHGSMASSLA